MSSVFRRTLLRQAWLRSSKRRRSDVSSWNVECSMSKSSDRQRAQVVEHVTAGSAPSARMTCAETTFIPDVIVQAWRSWTVDDARCLEDVLADVRPGRCPSGSPRGGRRSRRGAGDRCAAGSAGRSRWTRRHRPAIQPVSAMTSAATMTAPEPARSPITSRYAPRMLRLSRCASCRRSSEIAFARKRRSARPRASGRTGRPAGRRQPLPGLERGRMPRRRRAGPRWRPRPGSRAAGSRRCDRSSRSAGRTRSRASARPIPETSVSMCPASASSARLFEAIAPATSTTRTNRLRPNTAASRSRLAEAADRGVNGIRVRVSHDPQSSTVDSPASTNAAATVRHTSGSNPLRASSA